MTPNLPVFLGEFLGLFLHVRKPNHRAILLLEFDCSNSNLTHTERSRFP